MIEVISGPMYSGKTEELIRRLTRAKIANRSVIAFKPEIDSRYGLEVMASHSGIKIDCVPIEYARSIVDAIQVGSYDVIGIDEAQFFDYEIYETVLFLSDKGIKVIVAGLDMDYRREPFGCMPHLLAVACDVQKLSAVCNVCGEDACYTQRLTDGQPASFSGPTIQVGAKESYEARCWHCYESGE